MKKKGILVCVVIGVFLWRALALEAQTESTRDLEPKTEAVFEPYGTRVSGDRVNLRLGPSRENAIVGQASKDDLYVITGTEGDWSQILWPKEIPVWVYSKFIVRDPEGNSVIEGDNVNIRLQPGTNQPVVMKLMDKSPVKIVKTSDDWTAIESPETMTCWIYSEYLSDRIPLEHYYEKAHEEKAEQLFRAVDEQYEGYLTGKEKSDLAELQNKFEKVATYYPSTSWAKLSIERSKDIGLRILEEKHPASIPEVQKNLKAAKSKKNLQFNNSEDPNLKTYVGVLKDVGRFRHRIASFKIVTQDGDNIYLKGDKKRLADYPYGTVMVQGRPITSPGIEEPVIEVVDIQWFHE